LFIIVVVDNIVELEVKSETSRIAGFDFGLKVFLTVSDGTQIESPQFLKQSLTAIKKASRQHSKKVLSGRQVAYNADRISLIALIPC